jgi:hypothetical protein
MPNFNDYFPETQGNKILFPSDMIPCDEFQPLFWNLLLAYEDQEQLKKEGQIKPTLKQKKNGQSTSFIICLVPLLLKPQYISVSIP